MQLCFDGLQDHSYMIASHGFEVQACVTYTLSKLHHMGGDWPINRYGM